MSAKKKAVLIDIDNTLIDTAIRKQKLLQKHNIHADLANVKADFWLTKYFGTRECEVSKNFFASLDSAETINEISAELFDGALNVISWLKEKDIKAIYITSRSTECYSATEAELQKFGINVDRENLMFLPASVTEKNYETVCQSQRAELITKLLSEYSIVALIGDRPSDVLAAKLAGIPSILLRSTISSTEEQQLDEDIKAGKAVKLTKCNTWKEIEAAIDLYYSGLDGLDELRDEFINQYASWLGDIDDKIRTTLAVSSMITIMGGNILLKEKGAGHDPSNFVLIIAISLAVFSVLYSIRAITSRRTSGAASGRAVHYNFKQLAAILIGSRMPEKWFYENDDAIHQWHQVHNKEVNQSTSHLWFFHERYKTLDIDAIKNLRLFELRKTNYAKLYAERIASDLLMLSAFAFLIWFLANYFLDI